MGPALRHSVRFKLEFVSYCLIVNYQYCYYALLEHLETMKVKKSVNYDYDALLNHTRKKILLKYCCGDLALLSAVF